MTFTGEELWLTYWIAYQGQLPCEFQSQPPLTAIAWDDLAVVLPSMALPVAEDIYNYWVSHAFPQQAHLLFTVLTGNEQAAWHVVAAYALQARPQAPPRDYDVVNNRWIDWRTVAKRYARHSPHCDTGALCACGFAMYEKELAK